MTNDCTVGGRAIIYAYNSVTLSKEAPQVLKFQSQEGLGRADFLQVCGVVSIAIVGSASVGYKDTNVRVLLSTG